MKKNLRFLTVILLAALCLLFAGCAEQAAEPDGSAQDLLNLNDGADEVPADDGLDDTADESYPAEEDLAAFAGTYTCRTQGAEWSDLEIYDDGSWTLYGTDATRTGTLVYEEEYEMYYAYNDADISSFEGCWYYDGDLSADRYILIDAYGEWFYYARNEGDAEASEIDCGDLRIAEGETSTYYADSDWYSNVSYRVFEFDTGVLTWDEEGVFYRME